MSVKTALGRASANSDVNTHQQRLTRPGAMKTLAGLQALGAAWL